MDFGTVCLLLITIVKQPLSWYFFQFQFQRDLSSEGHRCWASCWVVRFTQIWPLSTLLFIVTVADMVRAARDAAQPEQEAIWERRVPGPPENVRTLPRAQTQSCPQRGKVPIHRKALTNSTTPRPMASRTLPRKPPPHPYNTISTPHRLVDPREEPPAGILRRSASKDSVRPSQATHILSPLNRSMGNLRDTPTTPKHSREPSVHSNGPVCDKGGPDSGPAHSGPTTLPPKGHAYPSHRMELPANGTYCNTFGRNGPLNSLSRLDENREDLEPTYDTVKTRSKRGGTLTRMDTVV